MAESKNKFMSYFTKLSHPQQLYVKRLERIAKVKAEGHIALRFKKRRTFTALVCTVIGIYFFTMHSVRQERFGEEFDIRPTDIQTNNSAKSST